MRKAAVCLLLTLLFAVPAEAQKVKTMTGTVVKTILSNKWGGIVIKVGNRMYGIETEYFPGVNDEPRSEPKITGSIEVGRRVQVFYTKIDNTFDYEGVKSWLQATKIVEVKRTSSPKRMTRRAGG